MKKIIAVLIITLIASCKSDKTAPENADKSMDSVKNVNDRMKTISTNQRIMESYHFITAGQLFDLSRECVTVFHDSLTRKTYGGLMDRASVKRSFVGEDKGYAGLLIFPCLKYSSANSAIDSIFFAYRSITDFVLDSPYVKLNPIDTFFKTSNHYYYNDTIPASKKSVMSFLLKDRNIIPEENSILLYSTVDSLSENFMKKYKLNGQKVNEYKYAFFLKTEVDSLLKEDPYGLGLRAHFGFDSTETRGHNCIRIILNSVNDSGDNLILNNYGRSRGILQRSWP